MMQRSEPVSAHRPTTPVPGASHHREAEPWTLEQWRRLDEEAIAAHCEAIRGSRPVPPTLLAVVLGAASSKLPAGDPRRLTDLGIDDDPHAEVRSLMRNELAESMVHTRRRRLGRSTRAATSAAMVAR